MTQRRPAYDAPERERIRRLLLRYKEDHGVGVPTLQLRIAEVVGDGNPDRVPLKSLQRFLGATHRTDDALVDHCMNFLMTVAPPPAEDGLADSLSRFLGLELTSGEGCAALAGEYNGRFLAPGATRFDEEGKFAFSKLTLAASGQLHLVAEEVEFNFGRDAHSVYRRPDAFDTATRQSERHLYRGIFLSYISGFERQQSFLLLLRNYMHMRCYVLRSAGGQAGRLEGDALEPPLYSSLITQHEGGKPYHLPVWERSFALEFERAAQRSSEGKTVTNT